MPWSGSSPNQTFARSDGTRTGTTVWQQADAAGVDIIATDHDTHDQDLAGGINVALKKDGGNTPIADLPMGGYRHTNVGAATALTHYLTASQAFGQVGEYVATVAGTANAVTLTTGFSLAAYAAGQAFTFRVANSNTGSTTVNVDGLGAKSVLRQDGTALQSTDLQADAFATVRYDGTQFRLENRRVADGGSSDVLARILSVGAVVPWPTATIPAGWLECNGAAVSRTTYAELFAKLGTIYGVGDGSTTFNLPDYRGEFLRGMDGGAARDPDAASRTNRGDGTTGDVVGTRQAFTTEAHAHAAGTLATSTAGAHTHTVSNVAGATSAGTGATTVGLNNSSAAISSNGDHTHTITGATANAGGSETRPRNVGVKFIILALPAAAAAASLGAIGLAYVWDTGTSAADPGTARIRGNNATLASITALYANETDSFGVNVGAMMSTWGVGTRLRVFTIGSGGSVLYCTVNGTVTDNGSYRTIPVSVTLAAGTMVNGASVSVDFGGADGAPGTTVPDISGLTEDTANDADDDFLIEYDTSAGAHKKVKAGKLGFKASGTGSVRRDLQAKLRDAVSAKDFGAAGDASTDDSAAINAGIAALVAAGGGTLYFPPGEYRVSSAITIGGNNIYLLGAGQGASRLVTTSATADIVTINGYYERCAIGRLGFNTTVTRSAGAYIRIDGGAARHTIFDVYMNAPWHGIYLGNCVLIDVDTFDMVNPIATNGVGIVIAGGNDHYLRNGIVRGNVFGQCRAGYEFAATAATWMDNCGALNTGNGCIMLAASGKVIEHVFTTRCAFDSGTGHGWLIQANAGGTIRRNMSVNDWCATMSQNGVTLTGAGTIQANTFLGMRVINNGQHGIIVSTGEDTTIEGCQISGNSGSASNTYSGVYVAANIGDVCIEGNQIEAMASFANSQKYGIEVAAGTGADIGIFDNDCTNNATGAISIGAGVTALVRDNLPTTANQALPIAEGGTGATSASAARTALGLVAIASTGSASDLSTGTVPAGRMPAHTGDVTSSSGAVALTIANNVVTYAKMQDVSATDKVLGRSTAGAGDVEEIACTSVARTLIAQTTQASMRSTGLGLGTAATQNTGTSGTNIPLLDGTNTWSAANTFGGVTTPVIVSKSAAAQLQVTTGTVDFRFQCIDANSAAIAGPVTNHEFQIVQNNIGAFGVDTSRNLYPLVDNAYKLGKSGSRWTELWAVSSTIQTSDAREKNVVGSLGFACPLVDVLSPVLFRWKVARNDVTPSKTEFEERVETVRDENGAEVVRTIKVPKPQVTPIPGVRSHAGFLAQDVRAALSEVGIEFAVWGLENKDDAESRQWVRPDQLIPVLWQALRETRAKIKTSVATIDPATATLPEIARALVAIREAVS